MIREDVKKIILYLVGVLGDKIEGKKKIMKLLFLIDYFDLETNRIVPQAFLNLNYCIYYYGVFSEQVANATSALIATQEIDDGYPLKPRSETPELEREVKIRVDGILERFGKEPGYKLEVETLKMVGIVPSDKKAYMGKSVQSLLNN